MTRRDFGALLLAAAREQSWPIRHNRDHVQGLDVNARWFWVSAVDRRTKTGWVWRVDRRTLGTAAERNITQGALYHPGGLQAAGGSLWVPIAEYRPRSASRILQLDPITLVERAGFAVEDHIGAVATDGVTFLFGANWDARTFYRWTLGGKLLASAESPHRLAVQDMKWVQRRLYAGGIVKPGSDCRLCQLDPKSFAAVREIPLPAGRCYTHEGMAIFNGRLYFLPEDEPRSAVYSMALPR